MNVRARTGWVARTDVPGRQGYSATTRRRRQRDLRGQAGRQDYRRRPPPAAPRPGHHGTVHSGLVPPLRQRPAGQWGLQNHATLNQAVTQVTSQLESFCCLRARILSALLTWSYEWSRDSGFGTTSQKLSPAGVPPDLDVGRSSASTTERSGQ